MEDWERQQAGNELGWLAVSPHDLGWLVYGLGTRGFAVLVHPPHAGLTASLTVIDLRHSGAKFRIPFHNNILIHKLRMAVADEDRTVLQEQLIKLATRL